MGFVQISLDFGFSPAQPENTAGQEEKKSSANGNGTMHSPDTVSVKNGAGNGFRRLTPPPPDRILAEEVLVQSPAEPVIPNVMEEASASDAAVMPPEPASPLETGEEVVVESSQVPELEEVVVSTEVLADDELVLEEADQHSEASVETAMEASLEEEVLDSETFSDRDFVATKQVSDEVKEDITPLAVAETEEPVEETVATEEETVPSGPAIVFFSEETEQDDDGPIEFELEPDSPEEESGIEKQVSIAYFQKADASDDEEVFEIPMFSKPSTGTDAKPVVIVRVKEKKEAAAESKSKRGRKSIREMMAEAEMVEIPEDELLFKKQYYGIGEVAKMFNVNTSLIRFWETEFDIIRPKKNRKGDRLFRPIDVKNLHLIHNLLRLKKFTIEGAKDFLKNNRKKAEKNFEIEQSLKRIRGFLLQMKADLG